MVLRNINIINFTVENKHKQHSLRLHDVSMYLFDSKDYSSGRKMDEIAFRKYFKTIVSKVTKSKIDSNEILGFSTRYTSSRWRIFICSICRTNYSSIINTLLLKLMKTNFPQLNQGFHAQLISLGRLKVLKIQ